MYSNSPGSSSSPEWQLQVSVFQLSSAREITASNGESFWWLHPSAEKWKLSFSQFLLDMFSPPYPICQSTGFPETGFWKPTLMSAQVCGAHCSWACPYQRSYFLGSQTHSYLRKHGSSSFSVLCSAPGTFLSEAFKRKSAVTVAQKRQSLTSGLAIGE